ncbi:hypothetical protein [Mesorhizobium sp. M0228]
MHIHASALTVVGGRITELKSEGFGNAHFGDGKQAEEGLVHQRPDRG